MKWNEPALVELRLADDQLRAVDASRPNNVVNTCGRSVAAARWEQAGMPRRASAAAAPASRCCSRAPVPAAEHPDRWHLVVRVLGPRVARESGDRPKPSLSLPGRSGRGRPIGGRFRPHMGLAALGGPSREACSRYSSSSSRNPTARRSARNASMLVLSTATPPRRARAKAARPVAAAQRRHSRAGRGGREEAPWRDRVAPCPWADRRTR